MASHCIAHTGYAALFIRQDANISAAYLHEGKTLTLEPQKALNYLHVIEGKIRVNNEVVQTGDAIVLADNAKLLLILMHIYCGLTYQPRLSSRVKIPAMHGRDFA